LTRCLMYKDYNMTQLTLPMETSVLISTNDISRNVNDIVETIPETEFDEFNCPNNKRIGFKRYAYRHDKNVFKRDFKLYECDDCSECPLKQQCMNFNLKTNKKIMKDYNWEYFKAQINKKLSEPITKTNYSQRKIDVEPFFRFMKAIWGFPRISVRGINKTKRKLGFALMALTIRKVAAQRAEINQKHYKKDNFYIIPIEIVFIYLSWKFMS
ncbi:transposase, partial [Staphylococcus haemolyticus]